MSIVIKTGIPEDQVNKVVHKKGPGHTFVETFYPNGLVINYDMLPDGTISIDCNRPLKITEDGSYVPVMD